MKFFYMAIGAAVALIPMASFVLIALEVFMIFQIAKSHNAISVSDLAWFCSVIVVISLVLKFIATWFHFFLGIGQIANALIAAAFIYVVYDVADAHYRKIAKARSN